MVEFGLKLQDNKVAEWSAYYIDYEKLKSILKKCGVAVKKYEELAQKRPEYTAAVTEAYRSGMKTPTSTSNPNLAELDKQSSGKSLVGPTEEDEEAKETTELKPSSSKFYGSNATPSESSLRSGGGTLRRYDSSGNLIARAIGKAASGVTDYFLRSFERSVRDALKDIDTYDSEFEDCLNTNIAKVNTFYNQKLEQLEEYVFHLKESVTHIRRIPSGEPEPEEDEAEVDDNLETPLVQHFRKTSTNPLTFARAVARKVTSKIGHKTTTPTPRKPAAPAAPALPTGDDAEDETEAEIDGNDKTRQLREADSINRALTEHYRTAKLLHNFAIMNFTGFVKIVKKYDKTVPKDRKKRFKKTIAPENICNEGKAVEALANRMEILYANWFCDRNVSEARVQMLTKKGDGLEMDWSQLRLGYRMGMCSILGLWVCWDCIWGLLHQGRSTIGSRTAFPVFRACAGLLMLQWCWGVSVWVWTRYRVNYIYLFEFNPSIVASPLAIFNEAVDNTLFFLVCTLLYYKAGAHDIPGTFPAGVFPFILVVYTIYQLVFPLRTRGPMWQSIWEVVSSPMTSPTFFTGYVGDIFTSLVKVFQDLAWTIFFVASGDWLISEDRKASTKHYWSTSPWYRNVLIPVLTLLPLWFRFSQCLRRYMDTKKRFPHLANAFKYALSQTVTLFGAFHPLYRMNSKKETDLFQAFWLFAFIASSLYSFFWDVYMDWGLGLPKYQMLGPRLMYPRRSMYYGTICIDLVLRMAWVLTLIPPESGAKFALPAYLTLVSMMLEIFRRTIWGFIRLENEHRSNTAGYRRIGFVPLHFRTGHMHEYKEEGEHRGIYVLIEVAVVTILVLGAAVVSVVAAQHATQKISSVGEL